MYKWGYALEKLQFTNFDLQICNCKVAMLAFSGYKVPTLHLQKTKLHSSNFGLQVWNDITHMYIYGTTNQKYWFTNLQLHGCNVRILTPLAFHIEEAYVIPPFPPIHQSSINPTTNPVSIMFIINCTPTFVLTCIFTFSSRLHPVFNCSFIWYYF